MQRQSQHGSDGTHESRSTQRRHGFERWLSFDSMLHYCPVKTYVALSEDDIRTAERSRAGHVTLFTMVNVRLLQTFLGDNNHVWKTTS